MEYLLLPFIFVYNMCFCYINGVYLVLSTSAFIVHVIITEILLPLIDMIVTMFACLIGCILLAICLLMGPALKSVPTENSFNTWVQQFIRLRSEEEKVPITGWFASIRDRVTTSVGHTLLFHMIVSNFTINFLFFGFMRLAICTNKSKDTERYIFVGIFNTWIPTPF